MENYRIEVIAFLTQKKTRLTNRLQFTMNIILFIKQKLSLILMMFANKVFMAELWCIYIYKTETQQLQSLLKIG